MQIANCKAGLSLKWVSIDLLEAFEMYPTEVTVIKLWVEYFDQM